MCILRCTKTNPLRGATDRQMVSHISDRIFWPFSHHISIYETVPAMWLQIKFLNKF